MNDTPSPTALPRDVEQQDLLNQVAKAAQSQLPALRPIDRARLFDGLALILPEAEAEQARLTAEAIRTAEQSQLVLNELLEAL